LEAESYQATQSKESRMKLHRNAKLGLAARFALVQARERGLSVREVACRFSVSPATVCRRHLA
jgi:hypothetical protein